MAWGYSELSSDDQAWMAADKPLILGENHVHDASTIEWVSFHGGADMTDADGPIAYFSDGYTDLQSYPSSSGTWRFIEFDFGASGVDLDTVAVFGTNLPDTSADLLGVAIADDAGYLVNGVLIRNYVATSTYRYCLTTLRHTGTNSVPHLYTSVRYLSLVIKVNSGVVPKIGEIFIGRRRQMKTNPYEPWDKMQLRSQTARVQAAGGPITNYHYSYGQRILRAEYGPHEDDRIDDLVELYRDDTLHGSRPFVWCDEPSSNPSTTCNMMHFDTDDWRSTYQGPQQRRFFLSAVEQGPDYLELEL